jgi:hypothetical protein
LGKIITRDHTLIAQGDVGYDQAGEFATQCARFMERSRTGPSTIDLSSASELVSPCLTAIYEDCRLHRPPELKVVVPERLARLFEPGELEGLFALEVL